MHKDRITTGTTTEGQFVESLSRDIKTLDDLLKVAKVDLTKFEVERYVVNKYDGFSAAKSNEYTSNANGTPRKKHQTVRMHKVPLFQVKVWLKPIDRHVELMQGLRSALIADIKEAGAQQPAIVTPKAARGEKFMLEMGIYDLHVGKFASMMEVGESYDIPEASMRFKASVEDFLASTSHLNIASIMWPIGNDMLHIDNLNKTTTRGTPQDVSRRYFEIYREASKLYRWAIGRSLEVAPVKFVTVAGNHDWQSTFHLGEELAAWFAENKNVSFDNDPKLRKYVKWGVNLIGMTHGSNEAKDTLPALMAREAKQLWAQTVFHEWHLGHRHQTKMLHDSATGVRIRTLPSLAGADAWHYSKGFVDRHASECYIWGEDTGYKGHLSYNV